MVATNGHFLTYAPNDDGREPGYYFPDATGAKADVDATYPDWRAVVDRNREGLTDSTTLADFEGPILKTEKLQYYKYGKLSIDARYLDIAVNGDSNVEIRKHPSDSQLPVMIYGKLATALVMPMRI